MAKFAYNNLFTMGNGMSPFYANYGFHPVASNPAAAAPLNPASKLYVHWMNAVHQKSTKRRKRCKNGCVATWIPSESSPLSIRSGTWLCLTGATSKRTDHLRSWTTKIMVPSRWKRLSHPFAVRLTLTRKWKIHNVFHVLLIEP